MLKFLLWFEFQLLTNFIKCLLFAPKNYHVVLMFKSSIFNLSSCTAFCDFYSVLLFQLHLLNYVLIYFKDVYWFKLVFLLQIREVMYHALQFSELRLNKKVYCILKEENFSSCFVYKYTHFLGFASCIIKISHSLCGHHLRVFANKPLSL